VRRSAWSDIVDGVRYVRHRSGLRLVVLATIVMIVVTFPFNTLLPTVATEQLHLGASAYGVMSAATGAGALLAGFLSGSFTRIRRQGAAVAVAVCAWGLAIAGFGLSGSLRVAAAFLVLAGAADLVSMVFRGTLLQQAATDEMRGRMQGVYIVVVAGGPRLADLLHGTLGEVLGTRVAVTGGGLLVVIAMVAVLVWKPEFWRYRPHSALGAAPDSAAPRRR
jgi:MFS family permease